MELDKHDSSHVSRNSDDQDVFEITDFTTATDWERFIADIESSLIKFNESANNRTSKINLSKEDLKNVKWRQVVALPRFSGFEFVCTYYFMTFGETEKSESSEEEDKRKDGSSQLPRYAQEMLDTSYDFPEKCHCIARWYGLREFIVLAPNGKMQPLTSMSRAKLVLSSLAVAANNSKSSIPMFVQLREPTDRMFIGIAMEEGIRTDFEMGHMKHVPTKFKVFDDFLDIFKEQFHFENDRLETIGCVIRVTYVLPEWPFPEWSSCFPDFKNLSWDVDDEDLLELPYGSLNDTTSKLQVSCVWNANGRSMLESTYESSLLPQNCIQWSIKLSPSPPPLCALRDTMQTFLEACQNQRPIADILGLAFDSSYEGAKIGTAFDRLTEDAVPTISSVVSKVRSKNISKDQVSGPIPPEKMVVLLDLLFPSESSDHPYPVSYSQIPKWEPSIEEMPKEHPLKDVLPKLKSCPIDSFLWRLTIILCHLMQVDKRSVAHLIYKVKEQLRYCWENSKIVPGVSQEPPNLATCLMYQKLQMLNICIKKRRLREGKDKELSNEEMEEDEDEFYECEEQFDEGDSDSETDMDQAIPDWETPEGRQRKLPNLKLIKHSRFIYTPVTQEPTPLTEDRIEERTRELLGCEDDPNGASKKTKLMASNLLSDMECFKAANPGAVFEDFVRWYSPRDWIQTDNVENRYGRKGQLSERMALKDNLWQELWNDAQPVPAKRQRRLFDETREVEIIFNWIEWLNPGNFCRELWNVLIHTVLCRLCEEPILYALPACTVNPDLPKPEHSDALLSQLEMIAQKAVRYSRQSSEGSIPTSFQSSLYTIESEMIRATNLLHKITGKQTISSISFSAPDLYSPSTSELEEEQLLECLVMHLLRNDTIKFEQPLKGPVANVILKVFSKGIANERENKDDLSVSQTPKNIVGLDHRSRGADVFGQEYAKEFIFRTTCANPEPWSRDMPQRVFVTAMHNEYRLALTSSQDTVFC